MGWLTRYSGQKRGVRKKARPNQKKKDCNVEPKVRNAKGTGMEDEKQDTQKMGRVDSRGLETKSGRDGEPQEKSRKKRT